MSSGTRQEVLGKLRRRYQSAGSEYRRKLIDQAVGLLGYHRKSAIRALSSKETEPKGRTNTGRPARYDVRTLTPWLKQIWQATDYACSRRLAATLPEWIFARREARGRNSFRASREGRGCSLSMLASARVPLRWR